MRRMHQPQTAEEVVRAALEGDHTPLRSSKTMPGLGEAYFSEISSLIGSEPERAVGLGRKWRTFFRHADRADFVLRGRAATLRVEGKWARSAELFQEAGRHSLDPVSRQSFQIGAIDSLARAGRPLEGIRLGRKIARALRKLGKPVLAARASLNIANALVWQDRYRDAAGEYRLALEALDAPIEVAIAKLGLSTCQLYGGDLTDSGTLASEAQTLFDSQGLAAFADQCEINIGHVALLQGRHDDAWATFLGVRDRCTARPDQARVAEYLGDVYYALNLFEDALSSYAQAEVLARDLPLNRANCSLGIGRTQAALGNRVSAANALRRAARLYLRVKNTPWANVARLEVALLSGRPADVRSSTADLNQLGMHYWGAQGALALAASGDFSGLSAARSTIARHGYVGLRWKGDWLAARASGRLGDYRRMAEAIIADRALSRSLAARTAYLRDKRGAFIEFLGLLLDEGTPAALAEAVSWISRTRSAALIDEIVAAPQFGSIRETIQKLRAEVEDDLTEPGGARRASRSALAHIPELLDFRVPGRPVRVGHGSGSVWVDLGDEFACIEQPSVRRVSSRCITETLPWLEFEMTAPMTNRTAPSESCERMVGELRDLLGGHHSRVCPDGVLWQVPWALLSETEPTVMLSPQFGASPEVALPSNARVVVWMHAAADIPSVAHEVAALLEYFPDARVCSSAEEARASLHERYDYIHVACHARVNDRNPMFSYFEFSDGPVYAVEIARSPLTVTLAVLAACDTGRFHLALPDEPDGFVRAFLSRGAATVVAGMWPLDDEAAYVTVASLVRSIKVGRPVRDALAEARRTCRNQFPHPYFWGPLTLYAGYHDGSN